MIRAGAGLERTLARGRTVAFAAGVILLVPSCLGGVWEGATAFFEPKVQDKLVAQHFPGYHLTAEDVRAKWKREGQQQRATVGRFELWT